jgi:hypothetical protein
VICTFGANLDFYEGPLWRHISRARNRVVLADDVTLARQLADLASGGSRLRYINRHYLAVPITNEGSAHAKLILLVDATGGTLLVGSGNVSIDGYASRGEVFCRYDISDDDTTYLPEFQAAKEVLDEMVARGYLDDQAHLHLDAVWADTPWVWAPASRAPGVCHNLHVPLAEQLVRAVAGERVLELIVHAPFHDERCEALRRLVAALNPDHVTVLLQTGRTSVDPTALARALDNAPGATEVKLAAAPEFPETYLHAKFILIRTTTRSVTVTGSANQSLAALWWTDQHVGDRPAGNIELVNLAEGPAERFHELLAGLDLVEPAGPVAQLDVSYLGDSEGDDNSQPRLTRGRWSDGVLSLDAAADLPAGDPTLVIAGTDATADVAVAGTTITAVPAADAAAVLDSRVVPVWLRIASPGGDIDTTPVYPYHPVSLVTLLAARRDPDLLRKAGSLDMEFYDDDLAALLDELDAALVIDRHSLWRLARRTPPPETDGDSHGPRKTWEDLDFDALRRHPRLAQYQRVGGSIERLEPTDLQIVLSAITDHFRGYGTGETPPAPTGTASPEADGVFEVDLDDMTTTLPGDSDDSPVDETPEEFEASDDDEESEERERRHLKIETRNRLAWQRFAERFTKALRDKEFLDVVGPHMAVTNAVILNHLLALLVAKGVVAVDRGIGCQVELWSFLWGEGDDAGYLHSLPPDEQMAALGEFSERGLEVTVLSAVDLAVGLTRRGLDELRFRLRHVWRRMLTSPQLCFTSDVLRRASGLRPASALAERLHHLAREWTRHELDDAIAAAIGTTRAHVGLREESVYRGPQQAVVEVVEISDPAVVLTIERALDVFSRVVAVDRSRDYIRVKHAPSGVVAAWDRRLHDCWWYDPAREEPVDLAEPTTSEPDWLAASEMLVTAARVAEQTAA